MGSASESAPKRLTSDCRVSSAMRRSGTCAATRMRMPSVDASAMKTSIAAIPRSPSFRTRISALKRAGLLSGAARTARSRLLPPVVLEPLLDLVEELAREDALLHELVADAGRRLLELVPRFGAEWVDRDRWLLLAELVEELGIDPAHVLAGGLLQLGRERHDHVLRRLVERVPPLLVEDDRGRLVDVV